MNELSEQELAELQDSDTWDWESAERFPPNPHAGAVIRVHVTAAEFRDIIQAARAADMTLETFVRGAALAHAHKRQHHQQGSRKPEKHGGGE
jgi:hypothetical protein